MLITELRAVEYLEFIKQLFRDNNYRFLLLSVARYGDSKKYFLELEEFWSSIDNLTSDKIAFLNFSSNINSDYKDVGYGERIISKDIQPFIRYNSFIRYNFQELFEKASSADIYRRIVGYTKENEVVSDYYWECYRDYLRSFKLKYLPKIKGKLNENISESATQLLKHLKKKESDVPFIYLFDLTKNDEYFYKIDDIFIHYDNFYKFIKTIIVNVEEEERLNNEIRNCKNEIQNQKYNISKRENTLKRKQNQLRLIPIEIKAIEMYVQNNILNNEQRFYLESIIKGEYYELKYPLKGLFPKVLLANSNINEIIKKYSNKNIKTLEVDLDNWIKSEVLDLETDRVKIKTQINELIEIINGNKTKLDLLYNNLLINSFTAGPQKIDKFKVAFTFAGENRGYVEAVAVELESKLGKGNLFYDNFFQAELARIDLDIFLQDIYHNKSDFIVVFLSKEYEHKGWCGIEWRSIRDLIKKKNSDKIILVKLEEFNLDGIFSIDGYLDGSKNNPLEMAELIYRRILL